MTTPDQNRCGWEWERFTGEKLHRGWYHVQTKKGQLVYMCLYSPERRDFEPLLRGGGWGDDGQPDVREDELAMYLLINRVKYCGPDETIRAREDAEWPAYNDMVELID